MATPLDISTFTPEQRRLFAQANALGTGVPTIDGNAPAMTPQSLAPTTALNLPEPPAMTPADTYKAIISAGAGSVDELMKFILASAPQEQTQGDLRTDIMQTIGKLSGKESRTLALEQEKGIPEQTKRLQEINSQVRMINAEAQAETLKAEKLGNTLGFTRGEQAEIDRSRAIKVLPLVAEAQAVQGNILLAQDQIDRTVALEFEPHEKRLTYLEQAYKFNREDLESFDKKRADALGLLIDERRRTIDEAKNDRNQILGLIPEISRNNPPPAVIAQIQKAKTLEEALGIAAPYLGTRETQIIDVAGRRQLRDMQTGELIKDMGAVPVTAKSGGGGGGGSGAGGGGTYSNDLDAIIGTVLSTIPTKFGQETFRSQIDSARNDADKINLVAAQVLKGQPAEFKNDFRNQAVGIASLDKAISALDSGVKTGVLNNSAQYLFNVAGKDFDPKLAQINGYITSAIQPYRNSVTGAAWGEQEDAEYQALFGSTKFSPNELRQRLVQTKELLKAKSAEGLNAFVNPLGTYDNTFATGNLAPTPTPAVTDNKTSGSTAQTSTAKSWFGKAINWLFGD